MQKSTSFVDPQRGKTQTIDVDIKSNGWTKEQQFLGWIKFETHSIRNSSEKESYTPYLTYIRYKKNHCTHGESK